MSDHNQTDLSKLSIRRDAPAASDGKSRTPIFIGAGVVVVLAVLFFIFRSFSNPAVEVETVTASMVTSSQGTSLLTATGYVVAQRKAAIASKATGRLVYLGFVEGDHVKKDQIIARIESSDVEAALAQAKANVKVMEADSTNAARSLSRANELIGRKLISQAEMDAAQAQYDRVIASIALARSAVVAGEVQVENTVIRAPFDGTILTKNADVGEVVSPLSAGASSRVAVVTLADMSSVQVEADVSESNIEKVTINQPCEIALDAYPDKTYKGAVAKIVPTADRSKATVMTKIRFDEIDSRVLPEMGAKVRFLDKQQPVTEQQVPKLGLPLSAITTRNGKKIVFVINDDAARETPIETGDLIGTTMMEIKSGITAGQKVVNKPADELKDGSRVKAK